MKFPRARWLTLLLGLAFVAPALSATDAFTGTNGTALATHDAAWTANTANDGLTGMQLDGSGNAVQTGFNFSDAFYNGSGTGANSKSHLSILAGSTVDAQGNLFGVGIRMNTSTRGYQCYLKSSTNVNTNLDTVGCRCNGAFMNQITLSPTLNLNTTQVEMILEPTGASSLQLTMNSTTYPIDLTNGAIVANCTSTVITGGFPGFFIYHNSDTPNAATQKLVAWTDDAAAGTIAPQAYTHLRQSKQ